MKVKLGAGITMGSGAGITMGSRKAETQVTVDLLTGD
jgi:hypothetical protein